MHESTSSIEDLLGLKKDTVVVKPASPEVVRNTDPKQVAYFIGKGMVDKNGRHFLFQVRGGIMGFQEMSMRLNKNHRKALRQVKQMNLRKGLSPREAYVMVRYSIQPEENLNA